MAPRSLSGRCSRRYRPRRRCLLKGCSRWFQPTHPQSRYCCDACRQGARRWRRWRAQHKYRASPHGRDRRQEQARRYRQRCRSRPAPCAAPPAATGSAAGAGQGPTAACEGKRPGGTDPKSRATFDREGGATWAILCGLNRAARTAGAAHMLVKAWSERRPGVVA